jgi:hypothetical protein
LNKTIISCHTLTPRPWNPTLEKQTVLSTTEVFRVYSSNKNAAQAEQENKEVNNKKAKLLEKKEKSIKRKKAEGEGDCEKKRQINGHRIGEMRRRKPNKYAKLKK